MARKQETSRRLDEQKQKPSMRQACELASSILNMSKADIDELLDVDVFEVSRDMVAGFYTIPRNRTPTKFSNHHNYRAQKTLNVFVKVFPVNLAY